ncbi:hypothetical protein V2J09_004690 [Rumex salicifolius]
MGKAARWFKGLLGMKKDKEIPKENNENDFRREKRRWSFARPGKDSAPPLGQIPVNIPAAAEGESGWLGNYLSETEKEQNKHAIAVAAATAAAADAAVAAAQAAVAVVRLTSHNRGAALFTAGREKSAAAKIQTVFRGYLARKALRALKGLVKLQAHVRGYLVRKQATATLHSMQALVRAQASARANRARRSIGKDGLARMGSDVRARRSMERFEEPRSEYHSKRVSASYDPCYDDSPKIVEIDTYKPRSRSSRRTNYPPSVSDYGDDSGFLQYPTVSSPLPSPFMPPARVSVPDRHHIHNDRYDWGLYEEEEEDDHHHQCKPRISTAHSTPRLSNSARIRAPLTPAKSVCGEGYFRPYYHHHMHHHSGNYCPSYMANTQSFRAKLRSHSAPRQRPEPSPSKKRMSLIEVMASRSSVSGVRMQRPSLDAQHQALFDEIA